MQTKSKNRQIFTQISTLTFICITIVCKKANSGQVEYDNLATQPAAELIKIWSSNDTINFVSCGNSVYSPFGDLKSIKDIRTSELQGFSIVRHKIKANGNREFLFLRKNRNKIILSVDVASKASVGSNIYAGEIRDSSVKLISGLSIGWSKRLFFNLLLKQLPESIAEFDHINLISCVDDIVHNYDFAHGFLIRADFHNNSYWRFDMSDKSFNK